MKNKKHGAHPHDKMTAMSQFNEGHWEKEGGATSVSDLRYAGEFSNPEDLKRSVDGLSSYVKAHRMKQ